MSLTVPCCARVRQRIPKYCVKTRRYIRSQFSASGPTPTASLVSGKSGAVGASGGRDAVVGAGHREDRGLCRTLSRCSQWATYQVRSSSGNVTGIGSNSSIEVTAAYETSSSSTRQLRLRTFRSTSTFRRLWVSRGTSHLPSARRRDHVTSWCAGKGQDDAVPIEFPLRRDRRCRLSRGGVDVGPSGCTYPRTSDEVI